MLYTGTTKITPLIYSKGGTATLTVVNHSSFDRSANEKVFLNQITGGWEIIDYASADINSITAKCDENIAKNGTGTVSLSANGQLMNHEVRDFSLGNGLTESNIDDNSKLLTINSTVANSFIFKNINLPISLGNHYKIKVKYKIINSSELEDISDIATSLSCCSRQGTNNWEGYAPYLSLGRKYNDNTDYFIGSYARYNSGSDGSIEIYKSYAEILDFNSWITMTIVGSSSGGTLIIKDSLGNEYTESNGNSASFVYARTGLRIGNSSSRTKDFDIVFDLDNCGMFDTNDDSVIWKPYKEIIA